MSAYKVTTIVPTKSDSHMIFSLQLPSIEYNATHKYLLVFLEDTVV